MEHNIVILNRNIWDNHYHNDGQTEECGLYVIGKSQYLINRFTFPLQLRLLFKQVPSEANGELFNERGHAE